MRENKLILIIGGARSGKSEFSVKLAQEYGEKICYIATAEVTDPEMKTRIVRHQKRRPKNWKTIEETENLESTLKTIEANEVIIIDCLTLLVNNLLIKEIVQASRLKAQEESGIKSQESLLAKALKNANNEILEPLATERLEKNIMKVINKSLKMIKKIKATVIVVTNELGLGVVPPYPLGRLYRDLMGLINQKATEAANEVYFMISGIPVKIKG